MPARSRLVGFALTGVFVALIVWRLDVAALGQALQRANYLVVAPAALLTLTGYLLRALRWRQLLRPQGTLPFRWVFPVLMIGFMANNLLPARMGEFVRAYVLGQKTGLSKSLGLATVLLERVFDGLTLTFFLLLLSLGFSLPGWGWEVVVVASVVFLGALTGAVLLLTAEGAFRRLLRLLVGWLPAGVEAWAVGRTQSFTLGLRVLRDPWRLLGIVGLSLGVWTLEGLSYLWILVGFQPGLPPGALPLAAFFVLVMVNLGIMLPSAPGYIGTFQFFAVLALGVFGVGRELALGVALVAHAMQYLLVTGLGLLFLWREQIAWSGLARSRAAFGPAVVGPASRSGTAGRE